MNEAVVLRPIKLEDLTLLKKWWAKPYVARWYYNVDAWQREIEEKDTTFSWIKHFIAEYNGIPFGFCQYYSCDDSKEDMGYGYLGGVFSVDYLIGEETFLRKGFGKKLLANLIEMIKAEKDAKMIVVNPDKENEPSRNLLLSAGFWHDKDKDVYILKLKE